MSAFCEYQDLARQLHSCDTVFREGRLDARMVVYASYGLRWELSGTHVREVPKANGGVRRQVEAIEIGFSPSMCILESEGTAVIR